MTELRGTGSTLAGLRVLQVGPLFVNHVRRWAEHAAALGCRVDAAGDARAGRGLVDLRDVATEVELLPESLTASGPSRKAAWLRDVVRRLEPDVVQAHWLSSWGCFATFSGHPRVVLTPWGSDVYLATGTARARGDQALRRAQRVIARSRHMGEELIARGAPPERLAHVGLGVDLERFRPPSTDMAGAIRRELGLGGGPVVLSLRAGTELYNLDVVIEAFTIARRRIPGATLVLVPGDAPLSRRTRHVLRGLRADAGVRVLERLAHAEMASYMRAATVGISIPSSDGSPNSVWEALASGLPLVLSDLPQIAERVQQSDAVRLVPPRPEEVSRALCEVLGRHEAMARSARTWALANLDETAEIDRLGRVYASIATGASSRLARSR